MTKKCVIRGCALTEQQRADNRHACESCTETIRHKLREIEAYLPMVRIMPTMLALPGRADVGRRFPGYHSTPPPGLIDMLGMLDDRTDTAGEGEDGHSVLWRLDSMCRLVHEERQGAGANEPDESYTASLGGTVTYLLWTAEWCAYQPWVDEHAANVSELHALVRSKSHDRPPSHLAPCLLVDCGGKVYWTRDIPDPTDAERTLDAAKCSLCGRVYAGIDLLRLRVQEVQ